MWIKDNSFAKAVFPISNLKLWSKVYEILLSYNTNAKISTARATDKANGNF